MGLIRARVIQGLVGAFERSFACLEMTAQLAEFLAFVCSHVFERVSSVLFVSRAEGDWQLLCGGTHDERDVPRVVGLNHLLDDNPSVRVILDLPSDWEAERSAQGSAWECRPIA
jgi:hypothetical protein